MQTSGKKIYDLISGDFKYSETILQYLLDCNLSYIKLNKEKIINENIVKEFFEIQEKIKENIPLQYAIGKWNFYGRDFKVNESVLIPRPETELLVDKVLKENLENKRVLDIGTGSGSIAISISLESKADVFASDISKKALELAKKNASILGANIRFIESDLFEKINDKFDIIISNPPYLSEYEYLHVDEKLYKEPKMALVGGEKGYEIYERIVKNSVNYLNSNGKIFFEIGYLQADIVKRIFEQNGFKNVKLYKDYSDLDRIMVGELCLNN